MSTAPFAIFARHKKYFLMFDLDHDTVGRSGIDTPKSTLAANSRKISLLRFWREQFIA